ncbi:hypothetical protein RJT34_11717 [Clitoria ternatea]|uniref:Uncharacterized protein n=1 Tax=Clitoria ternatea TaxID=43366 RepID=A0AAN9JMD2_CLITE
MEPIIHFIILVHACTIVAMSNYVTASKFSSILVFGDSTVDTGNNNYIEAALSRGDHLPYGKDFPGHEASGRFSNGKLVPDMIASFLNIKDVVPPYLDPNLSNEDLLTGVCFASGGSGLDEMTAASFNVLSMNKQIEYFKAYIIRLKHIAGENKTKEILANALVIFCAGANDVILNFYDLPTRSLFLSIEQYHDVLLDKLQILIKDVYDLGCRKIGIAGIPPIGCTPIQITVKLVLGRKCVANQNLDSEKYNLKLQQRLRRLQTMLQGSRLVYADLYYTVLNLINQSEKYGIEETSRGCCGLGIIEATPICNQFTPVCPNASKYLFWDSVHFSEVSYKYLANYIETEVIPQTGVWKDRESRDVEETSFEDDKSVVEDDKDGDIGGAKSDCVCFKGVDQRPNKNSEKRKEVYKPEGFSLRDIVWARCGKRYPAWPGMVINRMLDALESVLSCYVPGLCKGEVGDGVPIFEIHRQVCGYMVLV